VLGTAVDKMLARRGGRGYGALGSRRPSRKALSNSAGSHLNVRAGKFGTASGRNNHSRKRAKRTRSPSFQMASVSQRRKKVAPSSTSEEE